MQRSFGPSRSPTYYRYTSSSYESGQMKRCTLLWASFSRNPRDAIVCAYACACVCVRADNVERKEGGRKGECRKRKRKRGVHVPGMQLCRNPDCGRKLPRSLDYALNATTLKWSLTSRWTLVVSLRFHGFVVPADNFLAPMYLDLNPPFWEMGPGS